MSGPSPTDPDQHNAHGRGGFFGRRVLQTPREALQPEDAPPPPPGPPPSKRRPTLSAISGFFTFLLVAAVGLIAVLALGQQQLRTPGPLEADKVVVIAPRTEVQEIIAQLETEHVIDNPLLLNIALLAEGNRSRVKAGEYLFKQHASLRDVIDTLVSGREILHSITIPEGLTSEQIVQRMRENDLLTGDVREMPKEGTLLPETYRVSRGMSRGDLLRKMQDDQKRVLDQIWARRSADTPLRSPYELVTLASIVEKETGKADERPRVAGVFLNRLSKRMKLQSDPTIVYGLVGGKGTLGRGILKTEVERPTPYNTYVIEGLPPGPIANPGRAALEAVANPSRTRDLYFVADGTGGHAFAETLDQHARNVTRWRQIEKDARDKQGATSVDRVQPDAAPLPGAATPAGPRDQRGEINGTVAPVFGGLTGGFSQTRSAAAAPASDNGKDAKAADQQGRFAGLSFAPPAGADAFAPARSTSILDGPVDSQPDEAAVNSMSYAMDPKRRAEQKARAARLGLPAGEDGLPDGDMSGSPSESPPAGPPRVIRIYDASEGTPLDPLKDKTWDLNYAKTVPDIGPEGAPVDKPAAKAPAKPAAKPKAKQAANKH